MAQEYVYEYPNTLTAEDNNSYTQKRIITPAFCEDFIPEQEQGLWNNNLCSQDAPYCQPFTRDELEQIFVQFKWNDPNIKFILPVIVNGQTDQPIWLGNQFVYQSEGTNEDGKKYKSFQFAPAGLPEDVCCIYIKWMLYYEDVDLDALALCVAAKEEDFDQTYMEAQFNCLTEMVAEENIDYTVTEPYCEEKCRPTLVIKGEYPKYDCNENFYGDYKGPPFVLNGFKCQFRIHGEIAQQGYTFEETNINGKKKSSKQTSTWLLRTPKLPPYMADKLAVAFNSMKLTINGAEFRKTEEITKNNEDGNMWIINTTLTTECDEINFTCH